MLKEAKTLWILLILAVFSVVYLIAISKPIENEITSDNKANEININKPIKKVAQVDLVKLEADYKNSFRGIYNNYNKLIGTNKFTADQLVIIRDQLLTLRVPGQFKELHIDFIFAVSKMERFIIDGELNEKIASEELITKIKANNTWLN